MYVYIHIYIYTYMFIAFLAKPGDWMLIHGYANPYLYID